MITKIDWIKTAGIFENFKWNSDTPEFARINVIYGANGSGKTSLASALDEASLNQGGHANISVTLDDQAVRRSTGGEADGGLARIHVFSESFVSRSQRFASDDPDMEAILTIGERTVEADRRLAKLQDTLKNWQKDKIACDKAVRTADRRHAAALESISKQVVEDLTTRGGKYQSRSNYNVGVVSKHLAGSRDDWADLSTDQLSQDKKMVQATRQDPLPMATHGIKVPAELPNLAASLLASRPSTIILDTLQNHPEATAWVKQGRHLHDGLKACIFCGSVLSEQRLSDIDLHFSSEVETLERQIKACIEDLNELIKAVDSSLISLVSKSDLYPDLRDRYSTAAAEFRLEAKRLKEWAVALVKRLEDKSDNVLGKVDDPSVPECKDLVGSDLDGLISEHNRRAADHEATVQAAVSRIEYHHLLSGAKEVDECSADLQAAKDEASAVAKAIEKANEEITSLLDVAGDPNPSALVLNQEVARLLGRTELKFEPVGSRYRVTRDGKPAAGLSEGERTAISLIHFMEIVARSDSPSGKPIVVIDDPVSSLDSDIFMGVSTYIWSECLTKDHVSQLILLTHNFELFRQWDLQLGMLTPDLKSKYPFQIYELKCRHVSVSGTVRRRPFIVRWPPSEATRKKVRSSYHHAFMAIVDAKKMLDEDDSMEHRLDAQLLFPNVIRRMLEAFLGFKRPDWAGDLHGAMRNSAKLLRESGYSGDADALRTRLIRYANAYSHNDTPDTLAVVNPDEVGPAISAVFEFMRSIDEEHFDGLCKVIHVNPEELVSSGPT